MPPHHLGAHLRDLRALQNEYNYQAVYYGHFGHACIHMQTSFDLQSEDGIRNYGEFVRAGSRSRSPLRRVRIRRARRWTVARRAAAENVRSELMQGLREFKAIWDPDCRMNPGKLIDAFPPTENLRLGADYNHRTLGRTFAFR